LSENPFTDKGVLALATSLKGNKTLARLDFGNRWIIGETLRVLNALRKSNPDLEVKANSRIG
jgi:hypothetical protein